MDDDVEQWRPVPGFEGLYAVSNFGNVRSLLRRIVRRNGATQTIRERVLRPGRSTCGGYPLVVLNDMDRRVSAYIHDLVCTVFHGPRPFPGAQCRHLDGKSWNNHWRNLRLGTALENAADTVTHGTRRRGVMVHNARLSDDTVHQVFDLRYTAQCTIEEIADHLDVGISTVQCVLRGRCWTHTAPRSSEYPPVPRKDTRRPWTADEDTIVREHAVPEAAKILKRTRQCVQTRRWRLSLKGTD